MSDRARDVRMSRERSTAISFDLGVHNFACVIARLGETTELLDMRLVDLRPAKRPIRGVSLASAARRTLLALPAPDVALVERQMPKNISARQLELEIYRFYAEEGRVRVFSIDPARVKTHFSLRGVGRTKKRSAVVAAQRVLSDERRIAITSKRALSATRDFVAARKKDDYADGLLQLVYFAETLWPRLVR